jgi:dihydroorotase
VVEKLRPGDVLTHCFRPFPNVPYGLNGRVRPEVREARERGVIFDVGHGQGSFAWKTARIMMGAGFPPDTISSDVHVLCIDGPAFDLVTTMSKFLPLGMPLNDIVAAATANPARALNRPELGTLKPGSAGDASVLEMRRGAFELADVLGEVVTVEERLFAAGTVVGGRWWHPA